MKYIKNILLVLIYFCLNFVIINFLPYPANQISIIGLLIVWSLLLKTSFSIYYVMLLVFLFELFIGLPFGVGIISAVSVIYIMRWVLTHILTNRSTYTIILATIITIVLYRLLFFIMLYIFDFFFNNKTIVSIEIIYNIGWEILITTVISFVTYVLLYRIFKQINPSYTFK